ncbi:unnamed protein product [Chrysoparadoxa australica]
MDTPKWAKYALTLCAVAVSVLAQTIELIGGSREGGLEEVEFPGCCALGQYCRYTWTRGDEPRLGVYFTSSDNGFYERCYAGVGETEDCEPSYWTIPFGSMIPETLNSGTGETQLFNAIVNTGMSPFKLALGVPFDSGSDYPGAKFVAHGSTDLGASPCLPDGRENPTEGGDISSPDTLDVPEKPEKSSSPSSSSDIGKKAAISAGTIIGLVMSAFSFFCTDLWKDCYQYLKRKLCRIPDSDQDLVTRLGEECEESLGDVTPDHAPPADMGESSKIMRER